MDFIHYMRDNWNMDLYIILIVILSGFFQNRVLCKFYLSKDARYDGVLKTLIVSLIASAVYIVFSEQVADTPRPWGRYFLSYFAATSLYDLLVRPFTKWIKKLTGDTEDEKEQKKTDTESAQINDPRTGS